MADFVHALATRLLSYSLYQSVQTSDSIELLYRYIISFGVTHDNLARLYTPNKVYVHVMWLAAPCLLK